MNYDVTIDRDKYIGGSDIPIIFGISPFKTRWQLLLEKAEPGIHCNPIITREIEYGNTMEPKIRAYVNEIEKTNYQPDQRIKDDLRANTDGWDGKSILEIKTTSPKNIKENVSEYKHYLVQLLFYMMIYEVSEGVLAVYERPRSFDEEFDEENLEIFYVGIDNYTDLCKEIQQQIDRFRIDLERVRENPLLTEQDLQPREIIEAANWVLSIEQQLISLKQLEQDRKEAMKVLKQQMDKYDVKRWITDNGVKFTNVPDGEPTEKLEFDAEAFKEDDPVTYQKYLKKTTKPGRSGYVRVTLPK